MGNAFSKLLFIRGVEKTPCFYWMFLKTVQKIATGFSFSWLGALFDVNVNENKQIFQYAIEKVNENLLSGEEFQLEGQVADVVYGNEITVSRGLCSLLEVCLLFGIFF